MFTAPCFTVRSLVHSYAELSQFRFPVHPLDIAVTACWIIIFHQWSSCDCFTTISGEHSRNIWESQCQWCPAFNSNPQTQELNTLHRLLTRVFRTLTHNAKYVIRTERTIGSQRRLESLRLDKLRDVINIRNSQPMTANVWLTLFWEYSSPKQR